jgi:hypothetical protein
LYLLAILLCFDLIIAFGRRFLEIQFLLASHHHHHILKLKRLFDSGFLLNFRDFLMSWVQDLAVR